MTQQQVKDMLWLLQVSKNNLPYTTQRQEWNRIQSSLRNEIIKGTYSPIEDYTGQPLDIYSGIYQD